MHHELHSSFSIIIPTYNEERHLGKLLTTLLDEGITPGNTFVADGGSTDETETISRTFNVNFIRTPIKGRSQQMNFAAKLVKSDWLYFIHADTLPPKGFLSEIELAIRNGAQAGSFRSSYDSKHVLLLINAFFTRFDKLWCRGGDQTLFVDKQFFDSLDGFCENQVIMEDYDLIERLQSKGKFAIMQKSAIISARKYKGRSYWKVMRANYTAFRMYKQRQPSTKIKNRYQMLLEI